MRYFLAYFSFQVPYIEKEEKSVYLENHHLLVRNGCSCKYLTVALKFVNPYNKRSLELGLLEQLSKRT